MLSKMLLTILLGTITLLAALYGCYDPSTHDLTQEVLVKMKSVFDQAMRQFFEKNIAPTLTKKDIEKIRVYFPMVSSKNTLKSVLGKSKMGNSPQNETLPLW